VVAAILICEDKAAFHGPIPHTSPQFAFTAGMNVQAIRRASQDQQELQRTGRLLHADKPERHDVIRTEGEMPKYGKRLWALQEMGFTVKIAS
jgi:hypothetical protein